MPKPKKKARKQRVHLGDLAIAAGATIALGSIPDPNTQGDSAFVKLGYAMDAADVGNWSDPANGAGANLSLAVTAFTDNLISLDGVVVVGGGYLLHKALRSSSLTRTSFFRTKHHAIGL